MNFSSKILEEAVNQVSQLPGIGKRTALRLVLHLMRQPEQNTDLLSDALLKMRHDLNFCKNCHNVSDVEICEICSSLNRDQSIVCVVEDIRDVMAIENTSQYRGLYHVLGGKISPMDGIGPQDLKVRSLVDRVKNKGVTEIIFALSPTIEGDTTNFYIFKQLDGLEVNTSTIARGIAVGDELEFADEVTLGRSILHRVPYENSLKS
ncbi:DNA replication and repair protein RecR [Nonlabens dokdonensis]|jgi:recombination protein RecR|uniref:Recombination protein RecR n=2 Tax=Nonlabens dokdonensis TaxID=328515 RepID=L7W9L7_NONDD|nr:recombination mediator RecR [Nonlabens dokdonensis]AGC75583.1 recombination DNA repair protein [Nonlabens dokdonensis DSW-6]OUS14510.1 recombination protein RecR [Nonlabens dokdonensis]PZX43276.1 DNA replication and repair protein RecR [Nonlabens dokdonensis]